MPRGTEGDPTLLGIARRLENLARRWPDARSAWRRAMAEVDGYPAGSDAPKVRATAELTPTERAADRLLAIDRDWQQLLDDRRVLQDVLANMIDRIERMAPAERRTAPLCDATNREGWLDVWIPGAPLETGNGWADLTCRNVASRGKLCDTCSRREQRWREHHYLPLRPDGAYSQPAPDVAPGAHTPTSTDA